MNRLRRLIAIMTPARIEIMPKVTAWRVAGLLMFALAAVFAMGQIHPEPAARRGGISVIHPWAKGAAFKGEQFPVYVTFANESVTPDRLIAIETAAAHHAVLKALDTRNGIVRPIEMDELMLPPKQKLSLRPGRHQITLVNLNQNFDPGGMIPVTFVFERAGRMSTNIRVENIGEPEHNDHS